MLRRKEYLGHTVLRKTIGMDFKSDTRRSATEDEMFVFENTHEPIIDQETWDRVRLSKTRKPKKYPAGKYNWMNKYDGLLYCADCGAKMSLQVHETKDGTPVLTYRCSRSAGGNNNYQRCTMHHISEKDLDTVMRKIIRRVIWHAMKDEEQFAVNLSKRWEEQGNDELRRRKEQLKNDEKRFEELNRLIQNLYLDYAEGLLPERQYREMMGQYDNEQGRLGNRINELLRSIDGKERDTADIKRFIKIVRDFRDQEDVLDRDLLKEMIERIDVHQTEGGKSSKNRKVTIDVTFRFIGDYPLEPTPDEIREERQRLREEVKEQENRRRNTEARKKEWRLKKAEERRREVEETGHKYKMRNCAYCGKGYWPSSSTQRYCSEECKKESSIERNGRPWEKFDGHPFAQRECEVCGRLFWPTNSKNTLCSDDCREVRRKLRESQRLEKEKEDRARERENVKEINCACCGKLFIPKTTRQEYCCRACARKGWRDKNRKKAGAAGAKRGDA